MLSKKTAFFHLRKKNKLHDSKNKRNINADEKLKPIFKKDQVTIFEMTKLVGKLTYRFKIWLYKKLGVVRP